MSFQDMSLDSRPCLTCYCWFLGISTIWGSNYTNKAVVLAPEPAIALRWNSFFPCFHDVTSQKVSYMYDCYSAENTQIELYHISRKKELRSEWDKIEDLKGFTPSFLPSFFPSLCSYCVFVPFAVNILITSDICCMSFLKAALKLENPSLLWLSVFGLHCRNFS